MIDSIHRLVEKTENRQVYTKKINFFTLNYDPIVENILDSRGYFFHSFAASKTKDRPMEDIIGYDISKNNFIPTYSVFKLHGSADNENKIKNKEEIILPEIDKGKKALSRDFFKIQFRMKEELEKRNGLLFIIGYAGADDDVNTIINESPSSLRIYWLKYNDGDKGVGEKGFKNIETIEAHGEDSTKVLGELFDEVYRT